jgi:hypothetical protein
VADWTIAAAIAPLALCLWTILVKNLWQICPLLGYDQQRRPRFELEQIHHRNAPLPFT